MWIFSEDTTRFPRLLVLLTGIGVIWAISVEPDDVDGVIGIYPGDIEPDNITGFIGVIALIKEKIN